MAQPMRQRDFSVLCFSHIIMTCGIWLFTSHRQKSMRLPTYVYKCLWMNWILLKICQNHGAKKAKKTRQSFSIGYLEVWSFKNGPKVSVWPPNCILYNYKFVGNFGHLFTLKCFEIRLHAVTSTYLTKSSNMVYFKPVLAWRSKTYLVNLLDFTNCTYLQAKWAICSNKIFIIFDLLDIWTLPWAYDVMRWVTH